MTNYKNALVNLGGLVVQCILIMLNVGVICYRFGAGIEINPMSWLAIVICTLFAIADTFIIVGVLLEYESK